jgi:hypothetical protein
VKYSPLLHRDSLANLTLIKYWQTTLQQQAKVDFSDALSISSKNLFQEHVDSWTSIWSSGFSISRSLAPSTMNGDVINRTIYYVLCSTVAFLYDKTLDEKKRQQFNDSLFHIDRCYESHSTL